MSYASTSTRPSRALPLAPVGTVSAPQYVNVVYPRSPSWHWKPTGAPSSASSSSSASTSQSSMSTLGSPPATNAPQASQLNRKTSRPLPTIPVSPPTAQQATIASPTPLASGSRRPQPSPSRPLPTPPLQAEVRPPSSHADGHDPASTPSSSASSRSTSPSHSSTNIRPLPVLPAAGSKAANVLGAAASYSAPLTSDPISAARVVQSGSAPAPVSARAAGGGARAAYPSLKLRIDVPGTSLAPAEIVLESPIGPMSPIIFKPPSPARFSYASFLSLSDDDLSPEPGRDQGKGMTYGLSVLSEEEHEERVARELSELGFVEVEVEGDDEDEEATDDHGERRGASDRVPTPVPILKTVPPRSQSLWYSNPHPYAVAQPVLHTRSNSNSSMSSSTSSFASSSRSKTPLPVSAPPALAPPATQQQQSRSFSEHKLLSLIKTRSRPNLRSTPHAPLTVHSLPSDSDLAAVRVSYASTETETETETEHSHSGSGSSYGSGRGSPDAQHTLRDKSKPRGLGLLNYRWDERSKRLMSKVSKSKAKPLAVDELYAEEFVIRVELNVPTSLDAGEDDNTDGTGRRPRRASRLWVREKKGKRWVENDYMEVLASLRKL